jgi:hypothetical protein
LLQISGSSRIWFLKVSLVTDSIEGGLGWILELESVILFLHPQWEGVI